MIVRHSIFFYIFDDFILIMSWKKMKSSSSSLWSELRRWIFMLMQDGQICHAECINSHKSMHKSNGFPQNKDGNIWRYKKKTFSHCTVLIDELLPCFHFLLSFDDWYKDSKTMSESIWRPVRMLMRSWVAAVFIFTTCC